MMNIAIPEAAKKRIDTAIDHTNEARKIINDGVVSALELTHNVLMAGLGGLDLTTELSRDLSRRLIERGEKSENVTVAQARKVVDLLPRELHLDVAVPPVPHVDEVRQKAEEAVGEAVAEVKKSAEDAVHLLRSGSKR
jgi:polyhydroxyalkanoate synthesis regulator phasin